MGLKLELDYDQADQFMVAMLKGLHTSLQDSIAESARKLPNGDHHREDLYNHHLTLAAVKELYHYYTGKKL